MNDSSFSGETSHIISIVAIFLGASMSISFSRISTLDASCGHFFFLLIMATIIASYFFVFYSISEILSLSAVLPSFGKIFVSSILIIFIGMSDINGIFTRIFLWLLIAVLLPSLWRTRSTKIRNLYCFILFPLLISSSIYPFFFSSDLAIENDDIWLENTKCDGNGAIHTTLSLRIKTPEADVGNITVQIMTSNQITLDRNQYARTKVYALSRDEESIVKWNITFEGTGSHSFVLYLANSEKISNKRITIYLEDGQWKTKLEDVRFLENISIFFENVFP